MPEPCDLPVAHWPRGRVLITGGTGLIGGAVARWLCRAGVGVRVVVRAGRDAGTLQAMGAQIFRADVTDPTTMEQACNGCELVLHTAAVTRRTPGGRRQTWRVNADAPAIVWRAAREADVCRMVHCSTTGVHGPLAHWPIDEDAPLRPDTMYRRSKCHGEARLQQAAQAGDGPEVVIARISSVTGPGASRTWRTLFDSVRAGRVRLLGRGDQPIHVVDVDDVCQGLIRCLTEPAAAGGRYFIAGAEPTPMREVMAAAAEVLGVPLRVSCWQRQPISTLAMAASRLGGLVGWEPSILHSLTFLAAARAYRIDRARADIGYEPIYGLRQTLARTLAVCGNANLPGKPPANPASNSLAGIGATP